VQIPISATVRKCAANFKKTHQDTWHEDSKRFNEDQLAALSTLLSGSSYCELILVHRLDQLLIVSRRRLILVLNNIYSFVTVFRIPNMYNSMFETK
jgi:hypothetical protein